MKTHEKDFEILQDEIQKVLDKAETKMNTLIDDYSTKYENEDDAVQIQTYDLSSLFRQLSDFVEDHI